MLSKFRNKPTVAMLEKEAAALLRFRQMSIEERILTGAELSDFAMDLREAVRSARGKNVGDESTS